METPLSYSVSYETHRLDRADTKGAPGLIYYEVSGAASDRPYHIILSGSGRESTSPALFAAQSPSKQALFQALYAEGVPLVFIEKAGITENACDEEQFHSYNTIDQRAWDVVCVMKHLTRSQGVTAYVLIGASEGAEVVLRSLVLQDEATRELLRSVVLMAWGSDQSYGELVTAYLLQKKVPALLHALICPFLQAYICKQFTKIAAQATDTERLFLGNSYVYWESFMHMADIRVVYKNLKVPLCFVHGADDLITAHSDVLLRDLQLAAPGVVTWLRYEQAAHAVKGAQVARDVVRWLQHIW